MRKLLTGVDASGRSCMVETVEMPFVGDEDRPGRPRVHLYETQEGPPPPRPEQLAQLLDLGVAPGCVRWQVLRFEPGVTIPMHHTDTLDFDLVLEGSGEIVLDDGAHPIGAGDCIVVTGVDHEWRAGPDGFVLSVTLLGATPLT
jgi:quercetin dioxygenase-like cupin family protein